MTFTEVWEVWPFIYLLLLAGLQAIPVTSSRPPRWTAPAVGQAQVHRDTAAEGDLALAFALSTLFHFGNFTLPYIMFGNTRPASTGHVLPINIYYIAFHGFDFGVASATAVFNVAHPGGPRGRLPLGGGSGPRERRL